MPSHLSEEIDAGLDALIVYAETVVGAEATLFAQKLAKEVTILRAGGLSEEAIYSILLADAKTNGVIFGQYGAEIKKQARGVIQAGSVIGEHAVYHEEGVSTDELKWVVVQGGKVCPDCQSRAGRVESASYWAEVAGLPGTGWSICKHNCQCRLAPVSGGEGSFGLRQFPNLLTVPDEVKLST